MPGWRDITQPALVITSRQDHVVNPEDSDVLAEHIAGPVERLWLEKSFHVATLDYDRASSRRQRSPSPNASPRADRGARGRHDRGGWSYDATLWPSVPLTSTPTSPSDLQRWISSSSSRRTGGS